MVGQVDERAKPVFRTDCGPLQSKYNEAVAGLYRNCRIVYGYGKPVLIEGGAYPGIWLECGPLESTIFALYEPEIAVQSHELFFRLQHEDGYIPCTVLADSHLTGQIQMVVPIAATALETAMRTGDPAFLQRAYRSCVRWDSWLSTYRNTRGTGLCEAFCEWDTGHDNSPRFRGLPRNCPSEDARRCPDADGLPYLAPDLSASVYGGRLALSRMAERLGLQEDAAHWKRLAQLTRSAIVRHCYDAETVSFYDVDCHGRYVKILGDVLTRVLGEGIADQEMFEEIFRRHLQNPDEFWTPYPFPSISVSDPAFVRELPDNSWGGASQALTALRAPRWMESYGKYAHLAHVMKQWLSALTASPGFRQQMNPWTGEFSTTEHYSPSMCLMLDFVSRLYGVRLEEDQLEWNCRCPEGAAWSRYGLPTPEGWAELEVEKDIARLRLNDRLVLTVQGECRIITNLEGRWLDAVGTNLSASAVQIFTPEGLRRELKLSPNTVFHQWA